MQKCCRLFESADNDQSLLNVLLQFGQALTLSPACLKLITDGHGDDGTEDINISLQQLKLKIQSLKMYS